MKELSIEEKAKRYDEAINRMKRYVIDEYGCTRIRVTDVFPELKENEDERIRKELIAEVKEQIGCIPAPDCRDKEDEKALKQLNKWLAWLEKQGEQKTVDEIAKEVCKNKESAVTFLKSTGIMNEKGELADEYKIEQDEQNPAWSKEDERCLTNAIDACKQISDEDYDYSQSYIDAINFLKSLKDRYTWKPSDEQMEGIECTIKTLRYQLNAGDNRLDSLYNDLKKLREK